MYNSYIFDGHGHSNASDGLHAPNKIINCAIKKGIHILALTDHNTTKNIPSFLEYGKKMNQNGTRIITIPGIEISCREGDLLVYIPEEVHANHLHQSYQKPHSRPKIQEIIEQYSDLYGAYFVLPHPESFYISSVTIETIEQLLQDLPQQIHSHIGIEVYNWMSQIFLWRRSKEESHLRKVAKALNLPMFGGTDYHNANHIGNGHTIMYMEKLESQAFFTAFREKRTQAKTPHLMTFSELVEIGSTSVLAEINSQFSKTDFRIPKK